MKINIKATDFDLTQAVSEYVEKKVSTLDKYLSKENEDVIAQVEVGRSTQHHKGGEVFRADIHITGGGLDIYAVREETDLYKAIDMVRDEMVHNIVQSKGKRETLSRRSAEMMKNAMKGISDSTSRGFSWGMKKINFRNFKDKQ